MDKIDFEIAVGEAAQDAVWNTEHPLTHHLEEDDPLRVQYLREYQQTVGHKVLAAIETLRRCNASTNGQTGNSVNGRSINLDVNRAIRGTLSRLKHLV